MPAEKRSPFRLWQNSCSRLFVLGGISLIVTLSAALLFASRGAPDSETPDDMADVQVATAPLAGVQLVEVSKLSETGFILAPRDDSRVPKLLVDLVKDERIVMVSPYCMFNLVDGHPVWTWWLSGGTFYEADPGELLKRLGQRLDQFGFEAGEKIPAALPNDERFQELPIKFRRDEPGRQWRVEFRKPGVPIGNPPRVLVRNIACSIRGTAAIETPTLSEVFCSDARPGAHHDGTVGSSAVGCRDASTAAGDQRATERSGKYAVPPDRDYAAVVAERFSSRRTSGRIARR